MYLNILSCKNDASASPWRNPVTLYISHNTHTHTHTHTHTPTPTLTHTHTHTHTLTHTYKHTRPCGLIFSIQSQACQTKPQLHLVFLPFHQSGRPRNTSAVCVRSQEIRARIVFV